MGLLDKLRADQPPAPTLVTDPVCGMRIDPRTAAGTSDHQGKTVHFCAASCKRRFDADPAKYAHQPAKG